MKGTQVRSLVGKLFTAAGWLANIYILIESQGFNTIWSKQANLLVIFLGDQRDARLGITDKDGTDERLIWRWKTALLKICIHFQTQSESEMWDSISHWMVRPSAFLSLTSSGEPHPGLHSISLPPCPWGKSLDNSPRETESLRFLLFVF